MKKVYLFALLLLLSRPVFAETNFSLDITKDIILGGASAVMFGLHYVINDPVFTISNDPADKTNVPQFDRFLMFKYDKALDITGDVLLYSFLATPFLFAIDNTSDANKLLTYGVMYAEVLALTYTGVGLIKDLTERMRPYNYFKVSSMPLDDEYNQSFPSRHTALAFAGAGFINSILLNDYNYSKWHKVIVGGAYTAAVLIAGSRIMAGMHFTSDVLAGAAIGSVFGYIIPYLHKNVQSEKMELVLTPFSASIQIRL